ncbi:type IV toxin-antitoxin system AbiEi family antitoxin domain-containing protein [Jiangella alba]|uniref:Transcriptional regulator, AbiEi antitoxin, Type IV TA system n=1 Tax=Jiangella alba TaxID=561176 RepID=A0A1H5MXL5_9ACTN|nr:type IV toxin-antitoxin system AbiEi family antitoxin domain-containing protein [Jiangella alba]SEE93118.1 hypothetical protein SAMN04488561_3445 [Jiangella alba]
MQLPASLLELADEQDGLLTRQQVLAHGLSRSAIRHALGAGGRWQRVLLGVYATFTGPTQNRHRVRAALLHAGPEAVVTGAVACRGYGMRYVPAASEVMLLVPPHVRRAHVPIATIHRVRSVPAARVVRGVPCAPPERSALDAVRGSDRLRDTRATLCEVVQRGLSTPSRLVAEYDRIDPRGLSLARRAIDDVRAGCRSAPECELRDLIGGSRLLGEPAWNVPLPDTADIVPDAQYREARLALEVESQEWHRYGDAPEATERRRARYASLGWRVLPVSPQRLRAEPEVVLAEIEAAVVGVTQGSTVS